MTEIEHVPPEIRGIPLWLEALMHLRPSPGVDVVCNGRVNRLEGSHLMVMEVSNIGSETCEETS